MCQRSVLMASLRERRPGLQRFKLDGIRSLGTEIGRGSYAAVVELDLHGLKCAGKKLHRCIYDDVSRREQEAMLQRFEEECSILSKLRHPKVVQFLGVHYGEDSELPTLVMELMHTTLSACLQRYGRLPEEISYNILDDVATALCYLHGQQPPVIHRDLTANNVLLATDMRAKLSDLGVAKILNLSSATPQSTCPGTLAYMPPEAIAHYPTYDTSIDTFSYGVLMLHVLCGRWPFPGEANRVDSSDSTWLIPCSEAERREIYFQEIDPSHPLRPLINRCLSNHPPDRPSAVQILCHLRGILSERPPQHENKLALLNQHEEEKQALQNEVQALQDVVQQLTDTIEQHELDTELQLSRLQALSVEKESLESSVEAKDHELAAGAEELEAKNQYLRAKDVEIAAKDQEIAAKKQHLRGKDIEITAKDQEIAAKDREIFAIMEESTSKDATLTAKGEVIQRLLQSSERMMEYIASSSQAHMSILTPGTQLMWREGPNMPLAITAPQCVVINSKIYVGGGQTDDENSRYQLCMFDPQRDQWDVTSCPLKYFGIGCLEGRPVIYGGCYPGDLYTADGFVFDEQSQNWNALPPMLTARARPCIISSSFGIAVCGGVTERECIATIEVFLSATQQWCSTFPLPRPLSLMRAVIIGDVCYLFGGNRPSIDISHTCGDCFYASLCLLFEMTSTTTPWQILPTKAPVASAPANLFGVLAAVGGTVSPQVDAFSPSSQKWVHVGELPYPLSATTCLTQGMELLAFGGWRNKRTTHRQRSDAFLIGTLERI